MPQIGKSINGVWETSKLDGTGLIRLFRVWCLPDSIVHLSQLKTFQLQRCHKLENLLVEFGKLQILVELNFSKCSKLRCLPNSIVDLSQLKTFGLKWGRKLENLPVQFGKLQSLVELDLSNCFKL